MADIQESNIPDISDHQVQFIENAGQAHEDILYQVKSAKFSFDFTRDALLVNGPSECEECNESISSPVVVTVAGAQRNVSVEAFDELESYANFLIGRNESDWHQSVPCYGGIRYLDILPGINLTYTGKNGVLKREFVLKEGANPDAIRLVYGGSEGLFIADDGSLMVSTSFGNLTELAPYSYQEINGTQVEIESSYRILENGEVGYLIGDYDPAYPLVIDPSLEYSTLLGGSLEDYGMDIARDANGDVFVTGYTSSCNFPLEDPIITNSPFMKYNGSYCHNSRDAFITKIIVNETTGNATIDFSTYLGGSKSDFARAIAVDPVGSIYVTGDTFSEDFPNMLPFSFGGALHGSNDAFIVKLNPTGGVIYWADYIGGNFADQANDIALDSLNAVYLTGQTVGNNPYKQPEKNFPVTPNAYQIAPNPDAVMGDAFAVKISPTGQTLEYSTYISGSGQDSGNGIAVDGQGMAYIVGTTTSSNLLPSGVQGYEKSLKGGQDAFLFKMNFQAGIPPLYATYLGGATGHDYGQAVAVDTAMSAYVTGATASADFPVTNLAMQTVKGWPYDYFEKDAFVTKFNTEGEDLVYSTYLGGSKDDWGYDIKVDSSFRAHVTGYSRSSQIPQTGLVDPIKQASGGQDGFLTVIKDGGKSAQSSTFFGGYRDDVSHAVAISPDGNTSYVTGYTSSPTMQNLVCGVDCERDAFPVYKWINQTTYWGWDYDGGKFNGSYSGSFDAFVLKFGQSSLHPSFTATPICGTGDPNPNLTVTFTETTTGTGNILNRIWNFGDGKIFDSGSTPMVVSHNYTDPGSYLATLTLYTYTSVLTSDPVRITKCRKDISANFTVAVYNNIPDPIDVPYNTDITFEGWALNYSAASYEWQFGDGSLNQTGQTTHHVFTKNGTFTVNMTAPSGTCCDNNTNVRGSKNLRVLKPPMARFTFIQNSDCAPATVQFTDTSLGSPSYGEPSAWQWNFGDNSANVSTQNPSHEYIYPGTYTPVLTVSNIAGTSPWTSPIKVLVSGNVTAGFTASPLTGTAPLPVQFTDESDGTPTDWTWQFGDNFTSSHDPRPNHTYTQAGTYTVTLTAHSECGPDSTKSYPNYITVNGNTTPKILFGKNVPPNSPNPVNGTAVLNVTFLGNTTDGTLIDKAVWKFGDGPSNTTNQTRMSWWPADNSYFNTSHLYYTIGDYTPELDVFNNSYQWGYSGLLYKNYIGVYPPLIANFTADPTTGIVGQSILFTDHSSGNPINWTWDFGDGTVTSGSPSVTHSYGSTAVWLVYLTVENKYGVTKVSPPVSVTITAADTNGDISFVPQNVTLMTGDSNYRIVEILLNKADYGLFSYKVKLDMNSTAHAKIRDWATKPSWVGDFNYTVSRPTYDSITISGLLYSGSLPPGSRNISLGNISLVGSSIGDAKLSFNASSSSAQYGSSYMSLTGNVPADIHVYEVGVLPGQSIPPTDIWPAGEHDGLIDDFDGNGVVNTNDVKVFFKTWVNTGFAGMPIAPFDYYKNNKIDAKDIVEFFNLIW